MSIWPFQRSRADADAERLLGAVISASRRPEFFGDNKVPDTLEGRFELLTLHAALALIRVQAETGAEPLAQAFTDRLFKSIDCGLREAGVGDTAVPKRMRKLAGSFYGRLEAYASARTNPAALADALSRNVWRAEAHAFATPLAERVVSLARMQARAPLAALFDAAGWSSG